MVTLEQFLRNLVREEAREAIREVLAAGRVPAGELGKLVTLAAFARTRSISVSTVRKWISAGRVDIVRIGRAIRIDAGASVRPQARSQTRADQAMANAARALGVVR